MFVVFTIISITLMLLLVCVTTVPVLTAFTASAAYMLLHAGVKPNLTCVTYPSLSPSTLMASLGLLVMIAIMDLTSLSHLYHIRETVPIVSSHSIYE